MAYNSLLNCFFKCLWRKLIGRILPVSTRMKSVRSLLQNASLMALWKRFNWSEIAFPSYRCKNIICNSYFCLFCSFSYSVLKVVLCILTTVLNNWTAASIPESPCSHAQTRAWPQLYPAIYCRKKGEETGKRCNESWEWYPRWYLLGEWRQREGNG